VIALQRIATLDVAAASGLLLVDDELVIVADDELGLHRYGLDGSRRGVLPLFAGELPEEPKARKKKKPDLEALCRLPDGRWLALGSGSKKNRRRRGALVEGDRVTEVDLGPLYDALRETFDRVNVEGAAVAGEHLVLLTRRTGRRGRNALVRLDLAGVLERLAAAAPCLDAVVMADVVDVDLGSAGETPFGFTDATPFRGGLLFSAVAEETDDPVLDGACMACELGWLDAEGRVRDRWPVSPLAKLEGIASHDDGRLFAVADADDRTIAAPLFGATVP